jgi:hypothetical protein
MTFDRGRKREKDRELSAIGVSLSSSKGPLTSLVGLPLWPLLDSGSPSPSSCLPWTLE